MRIWERVRIENEMEYLVQELTTIENQYRKMALLEMNQFCKEKLQSVFYTWLGNALVDDISLRFPPHAQATISHNSASGGHLANNNGGNLKELFLRSTHLAHNSKHHTIKSFFFSPAKR